jgi:hypothetical protein
LLLDLSQANTAGGAEGPIVTEIAAFTCDRAINVWTGESGVDADPLDSAPETAPQEGPIRVHQQTLVLPGQAIVKIGFWGHRDSCFSEDVGQNDSL